MWICHYFFTPATILLGIFISSILIL
jgi:hypothetical protein